MFCARSRPTNKGNREQKPITKKLAEFHNQFILLTMMAPIFLAESVGTTTSDAMLTDENFGDGRCRGKKNTNSDLFPSS